MKKNVLVYKRCGCFDPVTGRRRGGACPQLARSGHGSWYFRCSVRDVLSRTVRVRRGGFASREAAAHARRDFLAERTQQRVSGAWTTGRWLRYWLAKRTAIRATTRLWYTDHVERFLIPELGDVPLGELTVDVLTEVFARIGAKTNRSGHRHSATSMARIRATLRSALTGAVAEGVIASNPARYVALQAPIRNRPVLWTRSRVEAWRECGVRPAVAVWTARQLARFLDTVRDDRLVALWWLLGLRGPRRGEAVALRWTDIDLHRCELSVARSRTAAGYQVHEDGPKTAAGMRTIALDKHTVKVLREHRRRQRIEYEQRGAVWRADGYVFTTEGGLPLHPQYVTRRFAVLRAGTDLPPVRLHDLRHGAACLAHAAGADLKTIQELLGHRQLSFTADTYTTVMPATQRRSAAATAKLVRRAAPSNHRRAEAA